jgi:CRP-like cAMP-binding protein
MSSYLVKTFLKYSVLFKEGQKGDSAFLLKEGRVEISKEIAGKKKVLAILTPISLFGEMAILLEDQKRTATAVALEDVKVVQIKKDDFDEFVKESPQIMQTVLDILVHRLRAATIKSMRVPSVFHGSSLILELLSKHGVLDVDYLHLAKAISQAFMVPEQNVKSFINTLAELKMVETRKHEDGSKKIHIKEPKNFVTKAVERLRAAKAGD